MSQLPPGSRPGPDEFWIPEDTDLRTDYENVDRWTVYELKLAMNHLSRLAENAPEQGLIEAVFIVAGALLDRDWSSPEPAAHNRWVH